MRSWRRPCGRWGHKIADSSIPKLLGRLEYRLQVNRKTLEGSHNLTERAIRTYHRGGDRHPGGWSTGDFAIDTKKKELIGTFKNGGSDYRPEGCPDEVNVHDFIDTVLGKAIPRCL